MRILHVSDLHATVLAEGDQRDIVGAALDDIAVMHAERPIDLVVFSGDLAAHGEANEFEAGADLLLRPLRRTLSHPPIVMVPGNHDVNRSDIDDVVDVGLSHTLTTRAAVAATLGNPDRVVQATARLRRWNDFHDSWYGDDAPEAVGALAWIHRFEIGGVDVAVAALNTSWRALGGMEDRKRLLLGEYQVQAALGALRNDTVKVIAMHHPLDWLAEFDADRARADLESNGVFVLSGHDHTTDPTMEISRRGAALYSRAGCLYADHDYANSYTILDLDPGREVTVSVRRWWSDRREFDQATDWHRGGAIDLLWPTRTGALPAHQIPLQELLAPLVDVAQEQSVLDGSGMDEEATTVSELVVEPRLWPVPDREVFSATVNPSNRPAPVEPLDLLDDVRVVIVAGGHSNGVTTALLWLLEKHVRAYGTHIPDHVRRPDARLRRLAQALRAAEQRFALRGDRKPPVILAVDDAELSDVGTRRRLVTFVKENPEAIFLVGSHDGDVSDAVAAFEAEGIATKHAFLGPFGRREVRHIVKRMSGEADPRLVTRVLRVVHRQRLSRSPLTLTALVYVTLREEDLAAVNESGWLDSFVKLLIDNPLGFDADGLKMDYRRREHLLERLADHLISKGVSRLARIDIEDVVLGYFRELGWESGSPGQLIDSLIRRRVLAEDDRGVGFRIPPFLHLFAAKRTFDDAVFKKRVFDDPIRYGAVIRHVAGLRRNDSELLDLVAAAVRSKLENGAAGLTPDDFDKITAGRGWSHTAEFWKARELLNSNDEQPSEEDVDELYEDLADNPEHDHEVVTDLEIFTELSDDGIKGIGDALSLLASVLQSSELVSDVELKTEVLREVIAGWGVLTVMAAMDEDERGHLGQMVVGLLDGIEDVKERQAQVEDLSRILIVTLMSVSLYLDVGNFHLERMLKNVLDDEELMASTLPALFATMLHSALLFGGWPDRLTSLYEAHGDNPIVREVARRWALQQYQVGKLSDVDNQKVEDLLVEILTRPPLPGGESPAPARARQKSDMREKLRHERAQVQWMIKTSNRVAPPVVWTYWR
jgi:metallophosphoesterase superfamily enzyme